MQMTIERVRAILEDPFENHHLTNRQKHIMRMSAEGYSISQIATQIDVSKRTVSYDRDAALKIVDAIYGNLIIKSAHDLTRLVFLRLREALED